ncbi:MAG TPA: hypothetical protein VF423_07715 [Actinomycetes bacterium]
MPENYSRLGDVLDRVAESAQAAARPQAASALRREADRRTGRRRSVVAVFTVVAVVAGFAVFNGGLGTSSRSESPADRQGDRSGPAPTQLATAPKDPALDRTASAALLVSGAQVAETLGTMWNWTASPIGTGSAKITPCQSEKHADAEHRAARSVVVTGGWSGDDTLSQLVEESSDETAARAAYDRAVSWFRDCDGVGVDQSDVPDSLTRRAAEIRPVDGVDDMRVIVRMREHLGPNTWTNTVAAVVRVDNLVTVLAWDTTMDDNPGAYDDGFVELVRQVATTMTGETAPSVPDTALLADDDEPVRSALGSVTTTFRAATGHPNVAPLCNVGWSGPTAGTVAARTIMLDGEGASANVTETVVLYESAATATAAADAAVASVDSCPAGKEIGGSSAALEVTGPGTVWALAARPDDGPSPRHVAVVRSGRHVAYLRIDSLNTAVGDDAAARIVQSAAARLDAG